MQKYLLWQNQVKNSESISTTSPDKMSFELSLQANSSKP